MSEHTLVGTISQSRTGRSLTVRIKGKVVGFVKISQIEDCLSCKSAIVKVTTPPGWKDKLTHADEVIQVIEEFNSSEGF